MPVKILSCLGAEFEALRCSRGVLRSNSLTFHLNARTGKRMSIMHETQQRGLRKSAPNTAEKTWQREHAHCN
jgi:hypothetical protein